MTAEYSIECVVIGAGVIGLAVGRAVALRGHDVLVLDGADTIGSGTSSRNSEVIHAGIYYPQGSLKAKFCVQGKQALYQYCEQRHVSFRPCGKLIVATQESQIAQLEAIRQKALQNGVEDLVWCSVQEAQRMEPDVFCLAALHSPSTGIVDSHALMLSYQGDIENNGGTVLLRSPVTGGEVSAEGMILHVGGAEPATLKARIVVNAGGLYASHVAGSLRGFPAQHLVSTYYAKGNYFSVAARTNFSRLIYPVPEPGGLGVHLTLDMAGNARFGPDVEWVEDIDYHVDAQRADAFYSEIKRYWHGLPDASLMPSYSGIRPKLHKQGEAAFADFLIQGPAEHGVAGLCNLWGIESPGLTSSLAIGAYVADILL